MDYKKMMGYGDKKKVTKKESKPKVNKVLENIKEEFGYKQNLKEVGNAQVHKKMIQNIDNGLGYYKSSVDNYVDFLNKQGHKKEAKELQNTFTKEVGRFRKFMKIKFLRMVDKLI